MNRINSFSQYLTLEFGEMKRNEVLPKETLFAHIPKGGKMPKFVSKMGYYQFGMFLDLFIRKILSLLFDIPFEHRLTKAYALYVYTVTHFYQEDPAITQEVFYRDKEYLQEVMNFISTTFKDAKKIELDSELSYGEISGHPDLIIDDTIYEIKTTALFNKMRIQTIIQLLSYYALARLNNLPITHIGLLLPAQKMVKRVNVSQWKYTSFWRRLEKAVATKRENQLHRQIFLPYTNTLGYHTARSTTLTKTFEDVSPHIPYQIFLAGRATVNFKFSKKDIDTCSELITERNFRIYVHMPYTINLSRKYEDEWNVKMLIKYMDFAKKVGMKGVVVHTGVKAKDLTLDEAFSNMRENVMKACSSSIGTLILETPAGESGELLSDVEEFGSFVSEMRKSGIKLEYCVDTCHVFSANYEPIDYLLSVQSMLSTPYIIHFNDSLGKKGCRKDRHARVGKGYIGYEKLCNVAEYARVNNIDCVVE